MPPASSSWSFFFTSHLISLCFLCFPAVGLSADSVLQAGEYVTDGGWGTLNLTQTGDETFYYSISTVGGNAHTCELDGHIEGGRAEFKPYQEIEACTVRFEPTDNGVKVVSQPHMGCSAVCGARASFAGEYLKVKPGCDSSSVGESRDEFKRLYQRKAFAKAEKVLGKVLTNCEKTTGWLDSGQIRNDLAITQFHLGRGKECLKTLEPLTGDADMTDEEIKTEFPPVDADNYLPIIKATRTNLKLCRQLVKS